MSSKPVLKTEGITKRFGGVVAVNNLSLEVEHGKITALIGPNGAGKTTAFNVITGIYTATYGKIFFCPDGKTEINIGGKSPDKIAKLGMARTFQNIRLFKNLTVYENILIAKHLHNRATFLEAAFRLPRAVHEEKRMKAETQGLLRRFSLESVADDKASSLPYGQQRLLEIARALATNPKLLLLDEPAAGMNPQETVELTKFINELRHEFDLAIFLIEHHMDLVMEISDRIYVIDFGETIAHGTAHQIQNNPKVIEAYLGVA